ncbi:MAG: heavy metal translocating P-type ATPase [Synechococcales cyanobacterium]
MEATALPQVTLLSIGGMSCAGCAHAVQQALADVPGVKLATVNFATQQARVVGDAAVVAADLIGATVAAGFTASFVEPGQPLFAAQSHDMQLAQQRLWIAGIPLLVLMGVMIYCLVMNLPHNAHHQLLTLVLAFPVVFVGGWHTHQAAWAALRRGSPSMDVLISLGTLPTYALGLTGIPEMTLFVEVAAMVMGFHLLSRYVEQRGRHAASEAIRTLLNRQAPVAHWHPEGSQVDVQAVVDVPAQSLQVGDHCLVKSGELIPMDGEVILGESSVDESLATGESWPVVKQVGSPVIGGTLNHEGLLLIRVTRTGSETFLAQMVALLQEVQGSRLPLQHLADRVTGYFVPGVVILGLISFGVWWAEADRLEPWLRQMRHVLPWMHGHHAAHSPLIQALLVMVAVFVVACPCALGLAAPMAMLVGSGRAAQLGILLRRGEAIQRLQNLTTVVFDKTGTLTVGQPHVTQVFPEEQRQSILYWAAAAEQGSEHPLARAILRAWNGDPLPTPQQCQAIPGQGVTAVIDGQTVRVGSPAFLGRDPQWPSDHTEDGIPATVVGVEVDQECLGWLAIADAIKPEAATTVAHLHQRGLAVVLLSGDHPRTAQAVADKLGIPTVYAGVLPGEKVEILRQLQANGQHVIMVGDGLNDAAALQQADLGIALGTGTDLAIQAADMTLVSGHLSGLERALELSSAIYRTLRHNLIWAFAYNVLAIPLATLGIVHPIMAEVAMGLSSISVIANSLSLQRFSGTTVPAASPLTTT